MPAHKPSAFILVSTNAIISSAVRSSVNPSLKVRSGAFPPTAGAWRYGGVGSLGLGAFFRAVLTDFDEVIVAVDKEDFDLIAMEATGIGGTGILFAVA